MMGAVDAKEYIFLTRRSPTAARMKTFDGIGKRAGEPKSISSSTKFSFELYDVDDGDGVPVEEEGEGWYENLPIELASASTDLSEWNIRFMNLSPPAQQHEQGSGGDTSTPPVFIYVVDTGIRSDHSLLSSRTANRTRVLPGYPANKTDDCNGHGTHVSSIAGGNAPIGIAGHAQLIPVAVFSCNGQGTMADLIGGVNWIIQDMSQHKRARVVVNLSLQTQATTILDILMEELWNAGALIVAAAGNSRPGARDACQVSPARSSRVVSVGAIAQTQAEVIQSSNIGRCVHLYAPGEIILGASPHTSTSTQRRSGTSMASAHVSGLAAYVWAKHPNLTRTGLYNAIHTRLTRPMSLTISDNQVLFANTSTYLPLDNGDGRPIAAKSGAPTASPTNASAPTVSFATSVPTISPTPSPTVHVGDVVDVGDDDEGAHEIATGVRGDRRVWHLVTMPPDSNCTVHSNGPSDTSTFMLATRRYLNKKQTRYQTTIHATLHARRKQYILRSSSAQARSWSRSTGSRTVIELYTASVREHTFQYSPITPGAEAGGGVRIRVPYKQFYIAISASISSRVKEANKSSSQTGSQWVADCST